MESSPGLRTFEDRRSLVFWNRAVDTIEFSHRTEGAVTTIDTGELLLIYTDDGGPFSSANLQVQRRSAAFWLNSSSIWTPDMIPSIDPGQLFGTFHTLDDGLNGFVGLNCSLLNPNSDSEGAADFFPCDFGLLSKAGFALVDDSRTPVWDQTLDGEWLVTREAATCSNPGEGKACFAGGFDTSDPLMCTAAGCCFGQSSLSLWYSSSRQDHFSDSLNCSVGCDNLYEFMHNQALLESSGGPGLVPLNLYWNANPRLLSGSGGDNVASSFPPSQNGYSFARTMGFVYDPSLPQPAGTLPLKLYYSSQYLDHYTTASSEDEQNAISLGYSYVGLIGYALPYASTPDLPFNCYAPSGNQDYYIFGHGANYDQAVADYTAFAGPVPIPRRHWMGISWSKWNESQIETDAMNQVRFLQETGFPLDTYIFDMQWHLTPAWGGYQWDPSRYTDVPSMLQWMHSEGLHIGANFHDDDGVTLAANPLLFDSFAESLGYNPSEVNALAFDIGNRSYADSLQKIILNPLIEQGLDMAWTDFQQGFPGVSSIRGVVPTMILNHYRFYNFSSNPSIRGTIHSRYAGRGDHRHLSSFGGDVQQSWPSLQFMIYFTSTAANAPLCWWGHEMMRNGATVADNSELFTRVNQFGAWSPTFTSWGNNGEDNDWWAMPEPHLSAVRLALLNRQQLLPYRYTLAAYAFKTGKCPIVPMYRNFPFDVEAYNALEQYMLGDSLIVAPVYAPLPLGETEIPVSVYLPGGDQSTFWVDYNNPNLQNSYEGGQWIDYLADIYEVPVLVKAGSVLPMLPWNLTNVTGISQQQYQTIQFTFFPSAEAVQLRSGNVSFYEDDGWSVDYLSGVSAWTTLIYQPSVSTVDCLSISVGTVGEYNGMVTTGRQYSFFILDPQSKPTLVSQGQSPLPESPLDGIPGSYFVAQNGDLHVYLSPTSSEEQLSSLEAEICF